MLGHLLRIVVQLTDEGEVERGLAAGVLQLDLLEAARGGGAEDGRDGA